jgi:c-di-GMP-binding flagellar brake protein YcgR
MSKGRDRRKSRRIKDPILIFLYRDHLGNKAARPLDLSLEGIGIQTTSPLNINENLQVAIIIGECQVNALGRVVYTRKDHSGRFRSGIKFEEISERNRGIIQLYLEKTQRQQRSDEDAQTP